MDNVVDLVKRKKIKHLSKNIEEMNGLTAVLKNTLNSLQPYTHYASIKRKSEDLFILYQDIKRAKQTKLELLERLKNEA